MGARSPTPVALAGAFLNAQRTRRGVARVAGRLRICISPYTPDIACSPAQPPTSYEGYQVRGATAAIA